jgi:hypothetical protein
MKYLDQRDSKYVWHCSNRHTKTCMKDYCFGTKCRLYEPVKNSFHDKFMIIKKGKYCGENN